MKSGPWRTAFLIAALAHAGLAAASQPGDPASPPGGRPEYRIAIWYRRDRPLESFKYQVYNLRKGEYTRAVEEWLTLLQTRFPGYEARVRDVVLAREKGDTELLRVGAVIHRELLAAAALEGVFLGEPIPRPRMARPEFVRPVSPQLPGRFTLPGFISPERLDLGPPGPSFPVPMPYPRPHP